MQATAAATTPVRIGLSSWGPSRAPVGAAPPSAATLRPSAAANRRAGAETAAEGDQRHEPDQERAVQRLAQPLRDTADGRRSRREAADDLLLGRPLGVEEGVVVALEHEAAALDADDPVQDLRAELAAVVEHDVSAR